MFSKINPKYKKKYSAELIDFKNFFASIAGRFVIIDIGYKQKLVVNGNQAQKMMEAYKCRSLPMTEFMSFRLRRLAIDFIRDHNDKDVEVYVYNYKTKQRELYTLDLSE